MTNSTGGDGTPMNSGLITREPSSPLTRELAKQQEISVIDNKQVNFSINLKSQFAPTTRATDGDEKNATAKGPKFAQNPPAGSNVPKNYKVLAKKQYELHQNRVTNMADTMESFFDKNKLYIKSAQQEETQRSGIKPKVNNTLNSLVQESM